MPRSQLPHALLHGSPASRIAILCGSASALLGLFVMAAWHTQSLSLIQVRPTYTPMQYNTALGFLLGGIGLLLLLDGRRKWVRVPAVLIGLLAGLSLAQDVFSLDLGIDELFMSHYVTVNVFHPGRMAPNTAICFLLAAGAIHVPVLLQSGRRTDIIDALLGSVVAAFGLVAFAGYIFGIESAYAWGQANPMAVHTAIGFVILGVGIVAFDWEHEKRAPAWVPLPVGVGVITATICLWLGMVQNANTTTVEVIHGKTQDVKRQIEQHVKARVQALARLRTRWEVRGGVPKAEWESDALMNLRDFPGYQAIEWADPSLHVRWVMPVQGNEGAIGVDLAQRAGSEALESAVTRKTVAVSRTHDLPQGGRGFVTFIPLTPSWKFDGLILGVFNAEQLLDALLLDVAAGYRVAVYDGEEVVYRSVPEESDGLAGRWTQEATVEFYDATWRLRVDPTPEVLAGLRTAMPEVVLAVGLLLTALLSLTIYFVEERRTRDVQRDLERTEGERMRSEATLQQQAFQIAALENEMAFLRHQER